MAADRSDLGVLHAPFQAPDVIGWDVGGAHLKAAVWRDGEIVDVRQWPCALWQGLDRLDAALDLARATLGAASGQGLAETVAHAITMTGEMVDLFPSRAAGVATLATHLRARLGDGVRFFAGHRGWLDARAAGEHWRDVASANWLASAQWVGASLQRHGLADAALLVDIGSTTTDIVRVQDGLACPQAHDDAGRLGCGELVYLGVVRTPLMALAPRIAFRGRALNVMNEYFATSADVFRLLGELEAAHDQHASADQAGKDAEATCQRLARMIGLDRSDADLAGWCALAGAWRAAFVERLAENLAEVVAHTESCGAIAAPLVAAGCGHFLVPALAARTGRTVIDAGCLPGVRPDVAAWARVCLPAIAVAGLYASHLAGHGAPDADLADETHHEGETLACGS